MMPKQDTQFQPGHEPWNKGKSYQPGGRCRETWFQRGRPANLTHNYLPIGSLRVNRDGYLERKMTDDPSLAPARRWTAVHRLVWQEAHGPVPQGMAVVFKPGTRTTELEGIRLECLEMITRRELMLRNSVHRHGPEIAALVQLRGALVRQINRKAKREEANKT